MIASARPRARMFPFVVAALAASAATTAGCDALPFLGEEEVTTAEVEQLSGSFGPCAPWFDRGVLDLASSADGSRLVYVASRRPEALPEDAWRSGSRAVFVRDVDAQGAASTRYIATTWSPLDEIKAYATADRSEGQRDDAIPLAEQIEEVSLSGDGTRIVIGASREGFAGGLAKLYAGTVPNDTTSTLAPPDSGLTIVPINAYTRGEAIGRFAVSPDGTKVAAALGQRGELRVYDLAANTPIVYSLGDDNEVEVSSELPPVATSIDVARRAAFLTGASALHWSPDSTRIAFARTVPVSTSYVQVVDVATGELSTVTSMVGFTAPQLAWAADGASLFVMTTRLSGSEAFGNTEVSRWAAQDEGDVVMPAVTLSRKANWRNEPNHLVALGNDRQFAFHISTSDSRGRADNRLIRLDLPAEGGTDVALLELSGYQDGVSIPAQHAHYAPSSESLAFLVQSGGAVHVGQRTYVLADRCPEAATAEPEAEAEPTGEE